ncbi:MAG TPA: AbrB/MazE/SpoVT family DNA-binding domain-containing protein [bacterium]|nr:AbrB/MazE/SpoVT family DNA-binding domain-containing protein [bacterium]
MKVQKWGNSLGVRIPKPFVEETQISDGYFVDINFDGENIIIKPVKKTYRLNDLLKKINPKNIHKEINTGKSVGKEIW